MSVRHNLLHYVYVLFNSVFTEEDKTEEGPTNC